MIWAAVNDDACDYACEIVEQLFDVVRGGEPEYFLGLQVVRDVNAHTITLTQTRYIDEMLLEYGLAECKPVTMPCSSVLMESGREGAGALLGEERQAHYRRLVDQWMYAGVCTVPQIACVVSKLAPHLSQPYSGH